MSNMGYKEYPKQDKISSKYVNFSTGARVKVYFEDYMTNYCLGIIVRDDVEEPYKTIIKLDDGRYITGDDCKYYSYIKKIEDLKDFNVGQTVWVKLVGDAKRFKKENESVIQEWVITRIGKKYIYAKKNENSCEYAFEKSCLNNKTLWIEKTNCSICYILYATYLDYLEDEKAHELRSSIYNTLQFKNIINELSLDQLIEIHNILNGKVSTTYVSYTENEDGGIQRNES